MRSPLVRDALVTVFVLGIVAGIVTIAVKTDPQPIRESESRFLPMGKITQDATEKVQLKMTKDQVIAALGQPFEIPGNPQNGSSQRVMYYAYPDGWVMVEIWQGEVDHVQGNGIVIDDQAYPPIQRDYAQKVGKPIRNKIH